jgi:hypothetical protein
VKPRVHQLIDAFDLLRSKGVRTLAAHVGVAGALLSKSRFRSACISSADSGSAKAGHTFAIASATPAVKASFLIVFLWCLGLSLLVHFEHAEHITAALIVVALVLGLARRWQRRRRNIPQHVVINSCDLLVI